MKWLYQTLAYTCVLTLLAAALAGCRQQSPAQEATAAPLPSAVSPTPKLAQEDSVSSRLANAGEENNAKDTMQISSSSAVAPAPTSPQPAVGNAGASKPVGKADAATPSAPGPKVDAKDAYKEENPTLLGLKLKASLEDVLAKLGKAKNKFVMDDDADPITVYEYAGFSVGFNKAETLEFVDVYGHEVDPGLHGLKIGQKSEDAFAALGKPDSNSTYVLTYKSQGIILKLDLDPKTDSIRSIKLFASK